MMSNCHSQKSKKHALIYFNTQVNYQKQVLMTTISIPSPYTSFG